MWDVVPMSDYKKIMESILQSRNLNLYSRIFNDKNYLLTRTIAIDYEIRNRGTGGNMYYFPNLFMHLFFNDYVCYCIFVRDSIGFSLRYILRENISIV